MSAIIDGTNGVTAATLVPSGSTAPINGIYLPTTNAVAIATNSTNALYIDGSQNVGIGTSSPITYGKLAVYSASGTNSIGSISNGTTGSDIGAFISSAGSYGTSFYQAGNGYAQVYGNYTSFVLGTSASGYTSFWTNSNERMRIDSSGIVTKPYQPGFVAVKALSDNYALTTTVGGAISFWATKSLGNHISSGYNTSTYTFTAPTAGLYFFTFCLIAYVSSGPGDLGFYVNGGLYLGDGLTINDFSATGWHSLSISHPIYLNSGDTCVAARAYGGANPSNTGWRGYFSGFLIG